MGGSAEGCKLVSAIIRAIQVTYNDICVRTVAT